jgi:hypothetical protein
MFLAFGIVASVGVCIIFFLLPAISPGPASKSLSDSAALLAAEGGDAEDAAPPAAPSVSFYETARLAWASRPMQLLIPIIFYNGASLGFFSTSFPLIYQVRPRGRATGCRGVP